MKTFKVFLIAMVLAVGFTPKPAEAQTSTTQTALSAAITDTTTKQISVVSATGMTASTTSAQTFIWADGERMQLTAISGTTLTVNRAVGGSIGVIHYSGAIVLYGQGGTWDSKTGNTSGVFLGTNPRGNCVAGTQQFTPVIGPLGDVFECKQVRNSVEVSVTTGTLPAGRGVWQSVFLGGANMFGNLPYRTVVNAAATATLWDVIVDYVSITATRVLTLPAVTNVYGHPMIIKVSANPNPDANTGVTVTAVNNQWIGTLGTTTSAVSYDNGSVLRLISVGGGWITW